MDQQALLKFVVGNKYDLDPTLTYLSAMPGAAGIVGFDRIGEAIEDAKTQKETARKETARLSTILDAGTRKYHGLAADAAVTADQRADFETAVAATDADAPAVIRPKDGGNNAPPALQQRPQHQVQADPGVAREIRSGMNRIADLMQDYADQQARTGQLLFAMQGVDPDAPLDADVRHAVDFASEFRSTYRYHFSDDHDQPLLDRAAVDWAADATEFLKGIKRAHERSGDDKQGPFAWAADRIDDVAPAP